APARRPGGIHPIVEEDELGERVGALGRLDADGHGVLLARPLAASAGFVESAARAGVHPCAARATSALVPAMVLLYEHPLSPYARACACSRRGATPTSSRSAGPRWRSASSSAPAVRSPSDSSPAAPGRRRACSATSSGSSAIGPGSTAGPSGGAICRSPP